MLTFYIAYRMGFKCDVVITLSSANINTSSPSSDSRDRSATPKTHL
jgi:hypothetical protein